MSDTAIGTAAPVEINIGEHKFKLRPWRFQDVGEFENFVAEDYMRRIENMIQHMPPEAQNKQRAEAMRVAECIAMNTDDYGIDPDSRTARAADAMQRYMQSVEGVTRLFWLSIRRDHEDITVDELAEMFSNIEVLNSATIAMSRLNTDGQTEEGKGAGPKKTRRRKNR